MNLSVRGAVKEEVCRLEDRHDNSMIFTMFPEPQTDAGILIHQDNNELMMLMTTTLLADKIIV